MKRFIWCDSIDEVAEFARLFVLSGVTFEVQKVRNDWRIEVLGA